MASTPLLPAPTVRGLADKLYERRKAAALEVEQVTKAFVASNDLASVSALVAFLATEFAASPLSNHRKGGLIGLAAATVGLSSACGPFLKKLVPPVLLSFADQDARVRYYACEAMYNIAKVSRDSLVTACVLGLESCPPLTHSFFRGFFNPIFDALCSLSADPDPTVQNAAHLLDRLVKDVVAESSSFRLDPFLPLLTERLNLLNPYIRQYLVGWISVLDSVPDLDLIQHLPAFLDGVLAMLSDSNREIRQQADALLAELLQEVEAVPRADAVQLAPILLGRAGSGHDEFTRLTSLSWLASLLRTDGGAGRLLASAAAILDVVLPAVSAPEARVAEAASAACDALLSSLPPPAPASAACTQPPAAAAASLPVSTCLPPSTLSSLLPVLCRCLSAGEQPSRRAALRWAAALVASSRNELLRLTLPPLAPPPPSPPEAGGLLGALMDALEAGSDEVAESALECLASLAGGGDDGSCGGGGGGGASESGAIPPAVPDPFVALVRLLVARFEGRPGLLEARGALALSRLAFRLGAERVLRACSDEISPRVVEREADEPGVEHAEQCTEQCVEHWAVLGPQFCGVFAHALLLVLLTSAEAAPLRAALRSACDAGGNTGDGGGDSGGGGGGGAALFRALFPAFSHAPVAAVALCLLSGAHGLAASLVETGFSRLLDSPAASNLLVHAHHLVTLLEAPPFAFLRLQLLRPMQHEPLLRTLYGLLLILPQSTAFATLSARLACVPALQAVTAAGAGGDGGAAEGGGEKDAFGADLLGVFLDVQERRAQHVARAVDAAPATVDA